MWHRGGSEIWGLLAPALGDAAPSGGSSSHRGFNEPQEVLPKAGGHAGGEAEAGPAPLPWSSAQQGLVPKHSSWPILKCEQTQIKSRYQVS